MIQCAVALYDCERVVISEHQGHGGEPDLACAGRRVAERGKRIPVPSAAPPGFGRGQADVLAARHMVVAKPIRGLSDAPDVLDGGVFFPLQRGPADVGDDGGGDAEFHCKGSSPARIVRCISRPLSNA